MELIINIVDNIVVQAQISVYIRYAMMISPDPDIICMTTS
jgi:hypothetical protein